MASVKRPFRLFTLSHTPEQLSQLSQLSQRAWRSLRVTHLVTVVLLGLMASFGLTVFAALFIPRQVADTAALTDLGLMLLASFLTLALGVWTLHVRLQERFKVGNIQIAGAILLGSGT
ncbi:MAG TPA: hypothetical protein VFN11_22655, partial [Ktedonobacterales bacterium]|nr:hypothetical protein [Ktedonobacterales bacterium]